MSILLYINLKNNNLINRGIKENKVEGWGVELYKW